tara:strand:- start:1930 stop:2232 length:303 start_codon:yes stop_codon:yes gene_type:complete
MPRLKKRPKYVYGESIMKGSEGGMQGGVGTFKQLNKYMDERYVSRLEFYAGHSPYMGNWAPQIYATDLQALKYGLSLARQYGFFDYESIESMARSAERLR